MSTVELTLTLLEVPSFAVVALVLESETSSRCSQGTATEMSYILLLYLGASLCLNVRVNFCRVKQALLGFFGMCIVVDLINLVFYEVMYLHVFAQGMTLL